MKSKSKSTILLLAIGLFSSAAHADWTPRAEIYKMYSNDGGNLYVQLVNISVNHANDFNCSSNGWIVMNSGVNAAFDQNFALLAAALHSGSEVSLNIAGCYGSYPKLRHVIAF